MDIDVTASDAPSTAGALTPAPSTNGEPSATPPEPTREQKLEVFERAFKALWPTPDPKYYVYTDVQRYAMSLLKGARDLSDDAQDVVQSAFVALFESWFVDDPPKPFPNNDEHFKALVFATVRQRAANRRRDESQLKRWLAKVFRERPASVQRWIFGYPDVHPFLDAVVVASKSLPPKTQQVFLMKWKFGYRRRHIAQHLKISVSTVDWHLVEANVRLAGRLADYRPERDENWIIANQRLEELSYPESSAGVRAREHEMSGDMTPKRVTGVMGQLWADPDKKKRVKRRTDPSEYSRESLEEVLDYAEPLTPSGVIALHRPVLPSPFGFLEWIIGLVRAFPDLYHLSVRGEDLGARLAYALAPYLVGEATEKWAAAVEQQLLTDPDVVEMTGPLLAAWQLAPARTSDAEVEVAWAEFQRRVGLSTAPPPQATVARIEAAAAMRRDFKVTHVRNKMWWGRLGGIVTLAVGGWLLWLAAADFAANGKSASVSGAAHLGFGLVLGGMSFIQSSRVQVGRRSRALVFALAAVVISLTMGLVSAWGGLG